MNILIVTEFFPFSEKGEMRGGVEARAFYIARELAKLKNNVYVITSFEKGLKREEKFAGIDVYRVGDTTYSQTGSLVKRLEFMKEAYKKAMSLGIKFDVVDGYNYTSYIPAYKIARKLGAKSMITYHEVWVGKWLKKFGLKGIFGEWLERDVLSKDWNAFIAVSENTKKDLLKAGIRKPIEVVYNGIDPAEFRFNARKENTIISVARLVRNKRIDLLINAFKLIKNNHPGLKLKIIGVGPEEAELKKLAGNDKDIEFFGFVKGRKRVLTEIKKSGIFVLPSEEEGFGIGLIEAIACGVPYVASDIPVLKEVTDSGKGGLLFRNGDYNDLADKINMALRGEYNKNGKALLKRYQWSRLAKQVLRNYER